MLKTTFDFSSFRELEQTPDGRYRAGKNGIDRILTPADGKSDFLFMGEDILVSPHTAQGPAPLYPLFQPSFTPGARAVLMDLDGTSVQSEAFWMWIIQRTMQTATGQPGFMLEPEDEPFVSGFSVSEHLQYCIDKYAPSLSLPATRRLYLDITRYEMGEILAGRGNQRAFRPADNLKPFLYALKEHGVKIGLVTSGLYEKAMPEIVAAFRQLDMGDPTAFYDAIITAGTTYGTGQTGTLGELCIKPHPWLYSEVAYIGLGAEEGMAGRIVGIEDSSAGVLSVILAGYPVIGMEHGNICKAGLEGLLSGKAKDLMDILEDILA